MLRKLVTLAAILTGLAAIAAPAEARVAAVEQVRIAASAEAAQGQAQVPASVAGPLQHAAGHADIAPLLLSRKLVVEVPAVRLRIDRARE